ncbi:acyltransferase [Planosporangium thailandense]|uniref:Acyltransferase n=1 Tax=Planosporangium thailandense TaxID=765197 RepID=A0ABX0Y2Y5_9ACTN|nr:acyltransferase [Planosporangium thailandense]
MVLSPETVAVDAPVPSRPAKPADAPTGRVAVVDGLRLVAAVMVMAYHYSFHAPNTAWGGRSTALFPHTALVTGFGWLGVELFFIISGFVICLSAWDRGVGQFFVSRVVRLFPAYCFAVVATAVVVYAIGDGHPHPPLTDLFVNLTMLERPLGVPEVDGVYWTLWSELHFYLLFAIVVWRGLTYRRAVTFCVGWLALSAMVATAPDKLAHILVGDDMSAFFVAGIAFYLMYRFGQNLLLWGIVGVSWAVGLHRVWPTALGVERSGPLSLHGVILVVTAAFAVMAAVALRKLSWIRGGWLTVAGSLTYPLYLLHQQIGWAVLARLHHHVPRWPLLIGLSAAMLAIAWLVHRIVERPLAPVLRRRLTDALAQIRGGDEPVG